MKAISRTLFLAVVVVFILFLSYQTASLYLKRPHAIAQSAEVLTARRKIVTDAFQHAWDGYSKYCFGHDTLHPVTNTCEDDFGGYGVTAIDALSSAIIFGNDVVVIQILELIASLDFTVVRGGDRIQLFEVSIRHFAAMLSAWDLLNGPFSAMANEVKSGLLQELYAQMVEFGDLLTCAFDTTSGVPRQWLDPETCTTDGGSTNTVAGVGTLILEFARLSDITKDLKYVKFARKAQEYLLNPTPEWAEPFPGLLGSMVSTKTGEIIDSSGSWGALADSFYEYLLKAFMYDSDTYGLYLERWLWAADSTMQMVGSHPYGHPELTLLGSWDSTEVKQSMDSLSWFAGGNFILGGIVTNNQSLVDYGLSIADAAGAAYAMTGKGGTGGTGLGGEEVRWSTDCFFENCDAKSSLWTTDGRFRLRPEVLETWYYAYRATRDPKYREWSWAAFEAINRFCRTETGFSALSDVNLAEGGKKSDVQESFVLAEVMKYVYLTLMEDEDAPYQVHDSRTGKKNTWIFNTEAHPLLVVGPPL